MKRFLVSITLLWLFAPVTPASNAAWPTFLGGNARVGYTNETLPTDLHPQWTFKTPAKPTMAWSGPRSEPIEGLVMKHRVDFDDAVQVVLGDDLAYFGSSVDHKLYCVEAKTGKPVWTFYSEGPIRLAPTLARGNVYFGSDDGQVYCLKASDGTLVWKKRVGPNDDRLLARGRMISRWPVRTGVLVDGDMAYFGAGVFPHENVYLCAANADDGSTIWLNDTISQQDAGRNDLSPQGYLLCTEDLLFVPSGRSLPVAISRSTGEIVHQKQHAWRTDAGGEVGGTKALLADGQVYSGGSHHFLAMDQQTGEEGEAWIDGRQMAIGGPSAYIATGTKIIAVDRAEHAAASQEKQKWFLQAREHRDDPEKLAEAQRQMKKFASTGILWEYDCDFDAALICTDNLVIVGGIGEVLALDRQTGQPLWRESVEGNVRGLSVAGGVLTVSTDEGIITAFSAESNAGEPASWPSGFAAAPFPDDSLSDTYRQAAKQILTRSGQRRGFCLVLGSEQGRLAYELARQSELTVYGVEPDAEKAKAARRAFEAAGLHGTRVTIVHADLEKIPFSNYFANLITSDSYLLTGQLPCTADHAARFLKPCGGIAILGIPEESPAAGKQADANTLTQWLTRLYWEDEGEVSADSPWYMLRRGKLAGAGDWSHQYGNVANTSMSMDQRIKDGLGVLWYGDPGPSAMINRHSAAAAPLSTNGRMFIQGTDRLMAYDAYNGTFLWDYENPGAIRTGVFNNRETSNLAASDNILYVAVGDTCTGLDAATGKPVITYQTPETADGVPRAWAYLAYDDGILYGTSTVRSELEEHLRRRGLTVKSQTDAVFAIDTETGERLWTYRGANILHTTITIGPERMYFIDSSLSPEERQQLYRQDKSELKQLTGDEAKKAEQEMKELDVRLAVAVDKRTGQTLWQRPVEVTDTTEVSAGGGSLTVMYAHDHLVLCGANANGHYWKQFLSGEFDRRKLIVLDARDGTQLWAKNANYMNRPAVIGNEIYAEPWAFDLHTGKPKTRPHPMTGEESPWRFSRPGHHCGVITATPNMMFFRSGFIGYYDLYHDSGTRHFAGQRLGCWINAIPGNGLVMIPEASAGCVCLFSIASTVVMEPKAESKSWGIFSAVGPQTPVQRMGINFGAPGDRKDSTGQPWFGYPRPSSRERLEFVFDIKPQLAAGGGWYSKNSDAIDVEDAQTEWLYTSGARGLTRFELPLLGREDAPASYTVKLHFAETDGGQPGRRPFDIRLQGQLAAGSLDIVKEAGGANRALVKSFSNVTVERDLAVEITPNFADADRLPTIAAVEVIREDTR